LARFPRLSANGLSIAIVAFTALLLVMLWMALRYQLVYDETTTLDGARRSGANLTRAFAEHVDGTLRPIDRGLRNVKTLIESGAGADEVAPALQATATQNGGLRLAVQLGPDGRIIRFGAAPDTPLPEIGTFLGDREYFRSEAELDVGRMRISKPLAGQLTGRRILVLSRRVNRPDRSFGGLVYVSFDAAFLAGFFSDLDIGPNGTFTIVGTDMVVRDIVSGNGRSERFVGTNIANSPLAAAVTRAPSGTYDTFSVLDGVHRIVSYRTLPQYGLIVVTADAYDDVLSGFRQRRFWLVTSAATMSALLIFAAGLLLRRARLQREAETALRQSEERFRALIENSNDMVIVVDRAGTIIYRSPSTAQQIGISDKDVIGRSMFDRIHPDDCPAAREALAALLQFPDRQVHLRSRIKSDDGWSLIAWSARNALAVPGVGGIILNSLDITETERLEEQLRQVQRLDAIGKLTGGVAHDFNNLLAVIIGNLDLVATELKSRGDLHAMVEAALGASERGAALTRSLLAFSRQQPLAPSTIDLNKLVREIADLLRRTVPENIEIQFNPAVDLWPCEVDPGELQNALLNLVVNARDAMPDGGRLIVETANAALDARYAANHDDVSPGQYVMLAVSDTGIGMAPEIAAKAFEPFFTTKEVGRGTGLGLSMVYGFAKQSGGHAKISSEPGRGTTVRIFLPHSAHALDPSTSRTIGTSLKSQGEKILVVEDAPDMRALTLKLLHSLGYAAVGVGNGLEALRALEQGLRFDLLLTDVVLPGHMNGRLLAEAVQRRYSAMKILYMSGYTEDAILNQGRLDRGIHLLQKPFLRQDLAAKLRLLLDRAAEVSVRSRI
jgi:PAS domain S-box-containing protein